MNDMVAMDAGRVITESEELASLLIDLGRTRLLVPNVCVAEIVPWRRVTPNQDTVSWHIGDLQWRSMMLPIISFEQIDAPQSEMETVERGSCLVVMNRVVPSHGCAFYGVIGASLPRMIHVMDEDLSEDSGQEELGLATGHAALLGSEAVIIPDLPYIGAQLDLAGLKVRSVE